MALTLQDILRMQKLQQAAGGNKAVTNTVVNRMPKNTVSTLNPKPLPTITTAKQKIVPLPIFKDGKPIPQQTAQIVPKIAPAASVGERMPFSTERARAKYSMLPEVRENTIKALDAQIKNLRTEASSLYDSDGYMPPENQSRYAKLEAQMRSADKRKGEIEQGQAGKNYIAGLKKEAAKYSDLSRFAADGGYSDSSRLANLTYAEAEGGHLPLDAESQAKLDMLNREISIADTEYTDDMNKLYNKRQSDKLSELSNAKTTSDFADKAKEGAEIALNEKNVSKLGRGANYIRYLNDENLQAVTVVNPAEEGFNVKEIRRLRELTEEEKNIMRYYAARGEYNKVEEYFDTLARGTTKKGEYKGLDARAAEKERAYGEELGKKYPILGFGASIASSFASPLAYFENAGQVVKNAATMKYEPTNESSIAFGGENMSRAYGAGVQNAAYDAAGGGVKGEMAAKAAGLGLSIGQNVARLPLGKAGLVLAGLQSAGSETLNSLEKGARPGQALATSSISGATEILTEYIPLDNLIKIVKNGGRGAVLNLFKQMGIEATEEMISEVINTISDIAIMGERSDYRLMISNFMAQGMSADEAKIAAQRRLAGNVLEAGAGGSISGGILSSGANVLGSVIENGKYRGYAQGIQNNENEINANIERGLAADEKSRTYKLANKLKAQQEADSVKNNILAKLVQQNYRNAVNTGEVDADRNPFIPLPVFKKNADGSVTQVNETAVDADGKVDNVNGNVDMQTNPNADTTANNGAVAVMERDALPKRPDSVGAATATSEGKTNISKVRTNTFEHSGIFTEAEKNLAELDEEKFRYDVISEKQSMERAKQRLETDIEAEVQELPNKEYWTGEDVDTSMGILREMVDAARDTGDTEAQPGNAEFEGVAEWAKLTAKRGTIGGQMVQAFAKYTRTPEKILVDTAKSLEKTDLISTKEVREIQTVAEEVRAKMGVADKRKIESELKKRLKDRPKVERDRSIGAFEKLWALDAFESKPKFERVLDKYYGGVRTQESVFKAVSGFADTLQKIKTGDKNAMIDLIQAQAKQRNTKVSNAVLKNMEGQKFEFLYDTALKQLEGIVTDYAPSSLGKKISTTQAAAQLLSVPTYLTNIMSNKAFNFVDTMGGNNLGVVFDRLIGTFTGKRMVGYEKVFNKAAKAESREAKARASIAASLDIATGDKSDRYGLSTTRTFKRTSNSKVERFMSNVERFMAYELSIPDETQKGYIRKAVTDSLIPLVESGNLTVDEATQIAIDDARYRTFQDDNAFSAILSELKSAFNIVGFGKSAQKNGGKIGSLTHDFGAGDFVCKYTQVAGSLISRGIEFSPIGYLKSAALIGSMIKEGDSYVTVKRGDKNVKINAQRAAATSLARATTGTGLIILCTALSKLGLLSSDDDEKDANKKALNAVEGMQGTQINLSGILRVISGESAKPQTGDIMVSIDRFQPFNSFATMGALIAKNEKITAGNTVGAAFGGLWKSIAELPIMTTMKTIIDGIQNNDEDSGFGPLSKIGIDIAKTAVSSFIPSELKRTARSIDNNYRDVYSSKNTVDVLKNQVLSGIPGARETLPEKLDNFGRVKQYGKSNLGRALSIASAQVLPLEFAEYSQSDISKELAKLSEKTGDAKIYPSRNAPYSLNYKGTKRELTSEQRQSYQKTRGQTTLSVYEQAIRNDDFKNLDVDKQSEVLKNLKAYAEDVAKAQYFKSIGTAYERNSTAENADLAAKYDGVSVADFYVSKYADKEEKSEKTSKRAQGIKDTVMKRFPGMTDEDYRIIKKRIGAASTKADKIAALKAMGYTWGKASTIVNLMK